MMYCCLCLKIAILVQVVPCDCIRVGKMVSIKVITSFEVTADGMPYPWVIKNVMDLDGKKFVTLDKNSTGFSRFVTSENKYALYRLTKENWLEGVKSKRNQKQQGVLPTMGKPSIWQARRSKERAKLAGTSGSSKWVALDMPAVTHDGTTVEACTINVAKAEHANSNVAVELDMDTLHYCRIALLQHCNQKKEACEDNQAQSEIPSSRQLKWSKKRKAFLATAEHENPTCKIKTFKVVNDGDILKVRDVAMAWIAFGDDSLPEEFRGRHTHGNHTTVGPDEEINTELPPEGPDPEADVMEPPSDEPHGDEENSIDDNCGQ